MVIITLFYLWINLINSFGFFQLEIKVKLVTFSLEKQFDTKIKLLYFGGVVNLGH